MDLDKIFGEGWSIYLWLIMGALIIIAAIYWIRWAYKNEQFDEDIKYLVFDEEDKDKMDPKEYERMKQVHREQEERRKEVLAEKEKEKEAKEKQAGKKRSNG